jgi:hypothetical protein
MVGATLCIMHSVMCWLIAGLGMTEKSLCMLSNGQQLLGLCLYMPSLQQLTVTLPFSVLSGWPMSADLATAVFLQQQSYWLQALLHWLGNQRVRFVGHMA